MRSFFICFQADKCIQKFKKNPVKSRRSNFHQLKRTMQCLTKLKKDAQDRMEKKP